MDMYILSLYLIVFFFAFPTRLNCIFYLHVCDFFFFFVEYDIFEAML